MESNCKTDVVSASQLFFLLSTARLSALLGMQHVSVIGWALPFLSSTVLSLLVFLLHKKGLLHIHSNAVRALLCPVLLLLAGYEIYAYLRFAGTLVFAEVSPLLVLMMLAGAVLYTASYGTPAGARFAPLCFAIVVFSLLLVVLSNVHAFELKHLHQIGNYPAAVLDIIRCADTPLLYLLLAPSASPRPYAHGKALFGAVFFPYFTAALTDGACLLVMGGAMQYAAYPVFSLFQLGEIGSFNKLDTLFTSVWLCAVYIKATVLLSIVWEWGYEIYQMRRRRA